MKDTHTWEAGVKGTSERWKDMKTIITVIAANIVIILLRIAECFNVYLSYLIIYCEVGAIIIRIM